MFILVNTLLYPITAAVIPLSLTSSHLIHALILAWLTYAAVSIIVLRSIINSRISGSLPRGFLLGLAYAFLYFLIAAFMREVGFNPISYDPNIFLYTSSWIVAASIGMELGRRAAIDLTGRPILISTVLSIYYSLMLVPITTLLAPEGLRAIVLRAPLVALIFSAGIINVVYGIRDALAMSVTARVVYSLLPLAPVLSLSSATLSTAAALAVPLIVAHVKANNTMIRDTGKVDSRRRRRMITPLTGLTLLAVITLAVVALSGVRAVVVTSGSMQPGIKTGDIVVIKLVNPRTVSVGDIILYEHENGYVLHRVISIDIDGKSLRFQTKGDANIAPDPWKVDENEVVGVAILKIPRVGTPILKMREFFSSRG
ncbi:MAG: signal peptidase I [Desulfurococcales archaeon]|nr:signal peptidase I [Desulfurococcales archaeon]